MDDGLVNTSNPDGPSLRSQRHEKTIPDGVDLEKQLTTVTSVNRTVEEATRTTLGRLGFLPVRLRICKYALHANMTRNTPVVKDHEYKCREQKWKPSAHHIPLIRRPFPEV